MAKWFVPERGVDVVRLLPRGLLFADILLCTLCRSLHSFRHTLPVSVIAAAVSLPHVSHRPPEPREMFCRKWSG